MLSGRWSLTAAYFVPQNEEHCCYKASTQCVVRKDVELDRDDSKMRTSVEALKWVVDIQLVEMAVDRTVGTKEKDCIDSGTQGNQAVGIWHPMEIAMVGRWKWDSIAGKLRDLYFDCCQYDSDYTVCPYCQALACLDDYSCLLVVVVGLEKELVNEKEEEGQHK